ncbi:MAG: hypothetical protein H7838_05210 [Magnetococcus sp. DMHC-8]
MDNGQQDRSMRIDPKYAPPYPQQFYRFWPWHAVKAGLVVLITLVAIVWLAVQYPLPTDPDMPPIPDAGGGVPAPEWYLFLVFQPFWFWTDGQAAIRSLGTFWGPMLLLVGVLAIPFLLGREPKGGVRKRLVRRIVLGMVAWAVWGVGVAGVVGSGQHAKTAGCTSCHNVAMGDRQSLPPANIGRYFRESRQQQVDVGHYRIGDTQGAGGSYKDANWQLRHFYEPTMTW